MRTISSCTRSARVPAEAVVRCATCGAENLLTSIATDTDGWRADSGILVGAHYERRGQFRFVIVMRGVPLP